MSDVPKPIGVGVAAVIRHNGRFLIGRRINPAVDTFPGGDLETTDLNAGVAAMRETFEETGILVLPRHDLFTTFDIENKGKKYITIYFLCDYISGEPKAMEPTKYSVWDWRSLDTVSSSIWIPKERIKEHLQI